MAQKSIDSVDLQADPEIEAMARVWIQEHWGMRWPDDVADEMRPEVRRLVAALRRALDDVRQGRRHVA
jgi:hypothetical protein